MGFFGFLTEVFKRILRYARTPFIWYVFPFFSGLPSITFTVDMDPCIGDDGRPLSAAEQHVSLSYAIFEGRRPVTSIKIIRLYALDHTDSRVPTGYFEEVYSVPPTGGSIDRSRLSASGIADPKIEQPPFHKGDSLFYTKYRIEVRTSDDALHTRTKTVQFGPKINARRTSAIDGEEPVAVADPITRTAFIDLEIDNVREILTQPKSRPGIPTLASMEPYTDPRNPSLPGITRVRFSYDFPSGFTPGMPDIIGFTFQGYDKTSCGDPVPDGGNYRVTIVLS